MKSITKIAKDKILETLDKTKETSHFLIDGTCGNGNDTLFLANHIGEEGKVWSFDIQKDAINKTKKILSEYNLLKNVSLHLLSHCKINDKIFAIPNIKITAFMFNLGYLPGSDKSITTKPESTIKAIESCLKYLHPEGGGTVAVYRGHPGGEDESKYILDWIKQKDKTLNVELIKSSKIDGSPYLLYIKKKK